MPTAPNGHNVLSVASGKKPNKHRNNSINLGLIVGVLLALAALVYAFFFVMNPDPPKYPSMVPPSATSTISITSTPNVVNPFITPSLLPTIVAPTLEPRTVAPNVGEVLPSSTPIPTLTATPFQAQIIVNVKSIWPAKFQLTMSGVDWRDMEGRGAACPASWPFGTIVRLQSGAEYTCIDRGRLQCRDDICQVRVFSPDPKLTAFEPAYLTNVRQDVLAAAR